MRIDSFEKYNALNSKVRKLNEEHMNLYKEIVAESKLDILERLMYVEMAPIQYIEAAFWEKVGFPPKDSDFVAMEKSGLVDKSSKKVSYSYDKKLGLEENFVKMRSDWTSKKAKINKYVSRLEEINSACGIEVIRLTL